MGMAYSRICSEEMRVYMRDTGFSVARIEMLKSRFDALDKGYKGYLNRADFLAIPELALNPVGDRIIHLFFQLAQEEQHHVGERLTFRWVLQAHAPWWLQCAKLPCDGTPIWTLSAGPLAPSLLEKSRKHSRLIRFRTEILHSMGAWVLLAVPILG